MRINPVDPRYNVALMASAGTGKTYNLALRAVVTLMRPKSFAMPVYDLYGTEVISTDTKYSAGRVMCLTFTRKATAEMNKRVYEYLGKLANGQFDEQSHEYAVVAEALDIKSADEMRRRALNARQNIFKDPRQLHISTIDGFMTLILKLFPFEADVRPDFSIIDDTQIAETAKDAFRYAFQQLSRKELYNQLFRRYIRWMKIQPYIFTTDLKNTVEWILERSILLEHELEEASGKSVNDLLDLIGEAEKTDSLIQGYVGKLLAYVNQPEDKSKLSVKLNNQMDNFVKLSLGQIHILDMFEYIDRLHPANAYKPKFDLPDDYKKIYTDLEEQLKKYAALQERLDVEIALHMSSRVHACVNKIKEEKGQLTYSDITRTVHTLLNRQTFPIDNEHLYFRLDGRLEHILADEFQDTSDVQWAILKPLAEEAMSGVSQSDKVGSFFCVGDSKQAIYRFRGATPGFMNNLVTHYAGRLNYEELDVNHRSDIHIVDFANKLFTDADSFIGGGSDLRFNFVPQKAKSKAEGYVQLSIIDSSGKNERMNTRLELLHNAVNDLLAHNFRTGDIAVIVTKKADGVIAHKTLQAAGIPSSLEFSEYLNARSSYKIISALLRYIYRRDEFSLAEFLFTPPAACSQNKLGVKNFLKRYKYILDSYLKKTEGESIYNRLFRIGRKLSLRDRLSNETDFTMLMDIMANRVSAEKNPLKFLETLSDSAGQTKVGGASGGGISVITVHGAKGLQFPATILFKVKESFAMHSNVSHFVDEPSGGVPKVYKKLRAAFKEYASPDYQNAMMRESAFIAYERINQLYVALTRACNALYIFVDTYSKNNTDEHIIKHFPMGYSAGALPIMPAAAGKEGQKQKADIFTKYAWNAIYPAIQESKDQEKALSVFQAASDGANIPPHIKTRAEQYIKKQVAPEPAADEKQGMEPYSSRYYGLFIHEAIYQLQSYTTNAIAMAVAKSWGLHGGYLDSHARIRAAKALERLISNEKWQEITKDAEIFREKVIFSQSELMIIDMFAKTDKEIKVIDYKTASPDSSRSGEYHEQVNKYKKALKSHFNLPTSGYLVYINNDMIEIKEV